MRGILLLVAGFAGCSRSLPAPAEPAWAEAVATPVTRAGSIDVAAAELGDAGAVARMHHRVRVKRLGRAWLSSGAPPIRDSGGGADDEDQVLPVIGESTGRIRVVTEEDGARVAVWIDRRDAWETVVAPVALDGAAGTAGTAGTAGVWLEAGAPIGAGLRGGRRVNRAGPVLIELRDPSVEVSGSVPAAFLGHVWIVPHDDRAPATLTSCPTTGWRPPADARPRAWLSEGEAIRAAPDAGARVLAMVRAAQDVVVIVRGAAWAEVELPLQFARIRGHVPVSALDEPGGMLEGMMTCGGGGFGISHSDRIEVPAGTCLYDKAHGDVAGVALEAKVRLGARGKAGSEWSMVYVDTRWSIASMYVRDTGRDPALPTFESCTSGKVRR